ncbi:uncharacterized protein LOC127859707 [Dreissena polymorpha]|uniref:RING-type domain-containing protein n=1 Tax=Dreissena polymorpha TaxID=45954 RepID=A0A9D3YQN5_DREPO|nr:uncharacterized protein LOC127859707 [Dreissena polymorpha]KAH3703160.1 hypothetical protein DPMN_078190 [Dreissena polymorpha]
MSKSVSIKSPGPVRNSSSKANNSSKPGSRNGLPPAPQLFAVKYVIDADVIKCPACMEVFKSPRVLPCGHSMCYECLNSLIICSESTKTKEHFLCPVCHKNTFPRDSKLSRQKWAQHFPVNSTILRLLRNASVKNAGDPGTHKAFCETCLMNNRTKSCNYFCSTCLQHICDMCHKYHITQEETKDHEMVFLGGSKEEISDHGKHDSNGKTEWRARRVSEINNAVEETGLKPASRDGKLAPITARTVTAADTVTQKCAMKLGFFNGKAPSDSATCDFRAVAFLTNNKVAVADLGNKKLKVFDITHKSRVELICDIMLRANPYHMCRVDDSAVAVVTERSNQYHIRLFTVRDKIHHFVHRSIDGIPLGIGYLNNTFLCSFLEDSAIHKYKISRAQQIKGGTIKHDRTGNDLFRQPSSMCAGLWRGIHVLYIADETEFGVTVTSIDTRGDRKASVFFDLPVNPSRLSKTSANGVSKTGQRNKSNSAQISKKENVSPSDTLPGKTARSAKQRAQNQSKPSTTHVSGRHTFRRVDDLGQSIPECKSGREIERTPIPNALKNDLSLDLSKITSTLDGNDVDLNNTIAKSPTKKTLRGESKAVERAGLSRPVGKVRPLSLNETYTAKASTGNAQQQLNSTIASGSTMDTTGTSVPPRLILNADSIEVDNSGNIYVCMSKSNAIHQMSPDGKIKIELLSEQDGLVAPKVVCFSPKNDFFLVTCLKTNRVLMFKLK